MKCPCNPEINYQECCQPYHQQGQLPKTAEQLMRSRYSAYVTGELQYLHDTIHPNHRSDYDRQATEEWSRKSEWLGLEIISTEQGLEGDNSGIVEFRANYKNHQGQYQSYEISNFSKLDGRWYYVDSEVPRTEPIRNESPKVGRNEPCPCGSGKKFKKCCG